MKLSWYWGGHLQFSVFGRKGQQLKYVEKENTQTPVTIRVIPSGFMNPLAKITSQKPSLHYAKVDKVYPDHANSLCKAGLAPPNFLTIGDLCKMQDEKLDNDIKREPDVNRKKNRIVYFCFCLITLFSYIFPQDDHQDKMYFNLSWLRVWMSYHRFDNFTELLNGDLATKIGCGILSKYLMYR